MGQYYLPIVKNSNGEIKTFYSHAYDNGLKLMEHSWIGNNLVASVLNELLEQPCQVYWLGDYAEDDDFKNKESLLTEKERYELWEKTKFQVTPTEENQLWRYSGLFVINFTKKEYIQLEQLNDDWQVCPICILTSVSNGKGGGDYWGINQNKAGIWAGDIIMISKQCILPDFINKTQEYTFEENR